MNLTEKYYKAIGHLFMETYPFLKDGTVGHPIFDREKEKKGTLKSGRKHMVYIPKQGKKIYGKIPKDISKTLKPWRKNAEGEVPTPQREFKQKDSTIIPLSYSHGVFGNSANNTDFLLKIKNREMLFEYLGQQSFSNLGTQIIGIKDDKITYDTSNSHMYQQEFESFQKALEKNSIKKEDETNQITDSKEVLKDYKEDLKESQKDTFENNLKKFNNHIHTAKLKFKR